VTRKAGVAWKEELTPEVAEAPEVAEVSIQTTGGVGNTTERIFLHRCPRTGKKEDFAIEERPKMA